MANGFLNTSGFMNPNFNFGGVGGGASAPDIWRSMPTPLSPTVAGTFAGSPEAYYQAARTAQMGPYASIAQFRNQAGAGFAPAFGQYMLQQPLTGMTGEVAPFSQFQSTRPVSPADWQSAVYASGAIGNPNAQLTARQLSTQGLLQGDNARRNALAMSAARFGGGIGTLASARQSALGNLYDLYTARGLAAGAPTGGFLSYLNQITNPTSSAVGGPPPSSVGEGGY